MRSALRAAYVLMAGMWLGSIVCFSFVVAPSLFRVLEPVRAGAAVGAILGPYYRFGRVAGMASLVGALWLGWGSPRRARWRAAALAHGVGLAATFWAAGVVYPETQRLREALHAAGTPPAQSEAFDRLHRQAVALNGIGLLAAALGLGCAATALRE